MSSRVRRDPDLTTQPLVWPSAVDNQSGSGVETGIPVSSPDSGDASTTQKAAFEKELEQKIQEAFRSGVKQGEATGRQKAAAELEGAIRTLAKTTAEIASLRPTIRRETERELVQLSLAIGRRILHRELTIDPGALSGLIKAAVQKIDLRETYRLRTNPEHTALLSRFLAEIGAPAKIEVVADPRLERGAAVFETAHGSMDASVDTQLAEIQHGFADLMGNQG